MFRPHAGPEFPDLVEYVTGERAPPPEPQPPEKIAAVIRRYAAGNGAITRTYPPGYAGPR